jgi:serine/threonine-protein kinase
MATLGRYTLERRIAAGGMAEVFLARQSGPYGFVKRVALKLLKHEVAGDDEHVRMFVREALVAAEFRHPNLAQVYEVGAEAGRLFIAMELVRGVSVAALLQGLAERGKGLPLNVAVRIAIDTLDGLTHAHEANGADGQPLGLVHRDISPQNIMVAVDGTVKVVDFGIARAERAYGRTLAPRIKGKFSYMAPEQWEPGGALDARADLFAVGVVLYEMTTGGARLFRGETPKDLYKAVVLDEIQHPRTRLPDYPPELAAIVLRALERGRPTRWPSARAMREALVSFAKRENWSLTSRAVADTVRDALGPGEIESRWEPVADEGTSELHASPALAPDAPTRVERLPSTPTARWMPVATWAAAGVVLAGGLGFGTGHVLGRRSSGPARGEGFPHTTAASAAVPGAVLRVRGTEVITGVADELRARWQTVHPETALRIEVAGATEAIGGLVAGTVDVALTLRAPSEGEMARGRERGVDLGEGARVPLGRAVAVVAVHPSNSVPTLDGAQAGRLFRTAATAWGPFGSDAGAVRIVMRAPSSELLALANETLLAGVAPRGLEVVESEAAARTLVASDPHAVTVLSLATAERAGSGVRGATEASVLSYPVVALTRGTAVGTARAFVDWLRAPELAPLLRAQSVVGE